MSKDPTYAIGIINTNRPGEIIWSKSGPLHNKINVNSSEIGAAKKVAMDFTAATGIRTIVKIGDKVETYQ